KCHCPSSYLLWRLLCSAKYIVEKKAGVRTPAVEGPSSGRPAFQDRRVGSGGVFRQRVGDHGFEHVEVLAKALPAGSSNATQCLRPAVLEPLPYLDEAGFFENLKVPAQVAIGEGAQLLQFAEQQTVRIDEERGQNAEPRLLVDDAVEAVVGEAAFVSAR